tara:strand:- start:8220 stop:8849 length:630 start_codon:yes stop_codon:yes gene_type:complete
MIPEISVIIPTYNREEFISRALRSILNQSISRHLYEIIVVDDGSSDNTLEVIKEYANEIRIIINKKNIGLPGSLNVGIKASHGRFIIRLDSDDYVHHDYLLIPYLYMTMNTNFDAVCIDYLIVDDSENIISRENSLESPIGCGIMFRHKQLISIGLYNEDQLLHEDKELMGRFLKKNYNVYRIQLPLYRYKMHDSNITKDDNLKNNYEQ